MSNKIEFNVNITLPNGTVINNSVNLNADELQLHVNTLVSSILRDLARKPVDTKNPLPKTFQSWSGISIRNPKHVLDMTPSCYLDFVQAVRKIADVDYQVAKEAVDAMGVTLAGVEFKFIAWFGRLDATPEFDQLINILDHFGFEVNVFDIGNRESGAYHFQLEERAYV